MLEQLKKYWAKVGEHPFLKHLFIIVCVLLVLGVATHLLLLLGTRHSAHRTVPDLTGIPLEEALGEARRQGLEIIVNDSLYVPAYDGGVVLDQLPEKGITVALAFTEMYLAKLGKGACRVHGGGFAGVIAVFLPSENADDYISYIEGLLGKGNAYKMSIRDYGAVCLNKLI